MGANQIGDHGLVVDRLNGTMNAHDIDAFVACFDEEYESEQPVHPDRAFRGREQVRQNWSKIFEGVCRLSLGASTVGGDRRYGVERVAVARDAV